MISGYYILPIDVFHAAASKEPFHACAHQIDDKHVICWARFPDAGHEQRFLAREGVEALPDATRNQPITDDHAIRLHRYGVRPGHTTMDVCDRLVAAAQRGLNRIPLSDGAIAVTTPNSGTATFTGLGGSLRKV